MTDEGAPVLLNCRSSGIPDARNVVILHGLFGDLNNWKAMAVKLSSHFHVHCMDLRNHGASPHVAGMTYSQMASDVVFTCKELEIEKMHLIGHSMGGKTAMQIALSTQTTASTSSPLMIESLVIVDIGPRRYAHHHNSIIDGLQALAIKRPSSRTDADALLQPFVDNAQVRAFLLKNLKRTDSDGYGLRINIDAITSQYDDIAAAISSDQSFDGRTLFIKGADSDYLTEKDRAPIAALFGTPALKTIDGAGHWPHSEKPDVVYKVLLDFLQAE